MTRFDRYLIRTLFSTFAITLTFLILIDFLIQSIEQASNIGQGNYTTAIMLLTLSYQLPEKLLLFAPAATLIGSIMGLGQLTSQNETIIVLASGITRLRLVRGSIILAGFIGISLLMVGESLAPSLTAKGSLIRSQALGQSANLSSLEGLWLNDKDSMIRIGKVNADGTLGDILRITPGATELNISHADNAIFQANNWHLHNPQTLQLNAEHAVSTTPSASWLSHLTPEDIAYLLKTDRPTNLMALHRQISFLKTNNLNHQTQSLAFWQKLLLPLVIITMTLLALPLAFNRGRNSNQGTRLVLGIMLGVSFYICQGVLANLAIILTWPAWVGAALPIILFSLTPLITLKK